MAMGWIIGGVLFLAYLATGFLNEQSTFPGIRPLLEFGPVKMDWRDIIALCIVGVTVYALRSGHMSEQSILLVLGAILAGKLIFK